MRPGTKVRLVNTGSGVLEHAEAVVLEVTPWGAHVSTRVTATGRYRAHTSEMVPLDPGDWRNTAGAVNPAANWDGPETTQPAVDPAPSAPVVPVVPETRAAVRVSSPASQAEIETVVDVVITRPPPRHTAPKARVSGYTGDVCDTCGSFRMVRRGACLCCEDCGTSGGCG